MKYCFVADDYKQTIDALGLKEPGDWMRYAVQSIVDDRTTETRRLKLPAPNSGCYAKIYRYPRWDDRLRILFRGGLFGRSRAKVEFDNLCLLHARGLSPRVAAYGQERKWGMQRLSFLVIEEVCDAIPLDKFIVGPFQSCNRDGRKAFVRLLADFTRKMNAGGFVNGEYHWRNILVCKTDKGYDFKIIDPSSSRRRYRLLYPFFDLATLDVAAPFFFSRSERLRFFKHYIGRSEVRLAQGDKQLLGKIDALRRKITQKELNRYRHILSGRKTP